MYSAGSGLLRPLLLLLLHPGAQPRAAPAPRSSPTRHPSVPTPTVSGMLVVGHDGEDTARVDPLLGPACPAPTRLTTHWTSFNHTLCCQHWPSDFAFLSLLISVILMSRHFSLGKIIQCHYIIVPESGESYL